MKTFKKKLTCLTMAFLLCIGVIPLHVSAGGTEMFQEGDAIYEDSNVSIAFDGIYGENAEYDIKFTINNFSKRTIEVQVRETSINGIMVDPICSIEISPNKTAKGKMNIWGNDAKLIPKNSVKNIETKFHIFDWNDDDFAYDTQSIIINYSHTHSYITQKVDLEPTCTENGTMKYICSCGNYYTETILATGHNYSEEVIEKATCISNGIKSYTCFDCMDYYTETIPKTGHEYSKWKTSKKPTIFKKGKQTRTCKKCGKKETKTVKKLKSSVTISNKKISLKKGKTYTLKIKKKSKGDKVVSWTSSKSKVVSVNKKTGKIKAKKKGKATITVKMKSGCKATCKVMVK